MEHLNNDKYYGVTQTLWWFVNAGDLFLCYFCYYLWLFIYVTLSAGCDEVIIQIGKGQSTLGISLKKKNK